MPRAVALVVLALCTLLPLPACVRAGSGTAAAAAGAVRIDGSSGVMPLALALARAYRARHPRDTVTLGAGLGATARLDAVVGGRIDVALASHGLDAADLARRGLVAHEIARAAVVVAVHAGVSVAGLTSRELCAVYAGRIADWAQVGGPALPIAPRARPAGEVDADVVGAHVPCLRDAVPAAHVRTLDTPERMADELARTPGAVGVTSLPFVQASGGRLRALALDGVTPSAVRVRDGTWPLTRRSVFVTRASPSPSVLRFLAFARGPEGARVIDAGGAVPAGAP